MAGNKILNYTGVDFDSLRAQVEKYLERDPRFENIRESAVAKTLLDVFAAMTDMTNYYLERRAEEQYLETARLRSSAILLSRNLGYVPTRPVPAKAGINLVIKGPLPAGLVGNAGETLILEKFNTVFSGEGFPFILKDTYTYAFTDADIANGVGNSNFEKIISKAVSLSGTNSSIPLDSTGDVLESSLLDIEVLQGEIKTHTILGSSNNQVGLIFQQYALSDTTFSDYYGEEDFGYDITSDTNILNQNLTKLAVGTSASVLNDSAELFTIRRRTIVDPNNVPTEENIPKTVLIRTAQDEGVDLSFGDDRFSSKGARSSTDNIYLQYFSTLGDKANKVGVTGNKLSTSNSFITTQNNINITNNISFTFSKNIRNGDSLESIESIKLNAPEIFFSLDRLVTKRDYVSYLKKQIIGESNKKIKNAKAWGEQEEILPRNQIANFRFFNVVFFTVLGSMYKFPINGTNTFLTDTELIDSYLEQEEDFSNIISTSTGVVSAGGYPEQSYFNTFVKESASVTIARVEDFRTVQADHPIVELYDKLSSRGQNTLRHIYLSPIIQKFTLDGRVTLGKLENRAATQKKINNIIYNYLNEVADFGVEIQKSVIYDLIQNNREVINSNITLTPITPTPLITTWEDDPDFVVLANDVNGVTSATVKQVLINSISSYTTSAGHARIKEEVNPELFSLNTSAATTLSGTPNIWVHTGSLSADWVTEDNMHNRVGNVSERTFYTELMKDIYDGFATGGAGWTRTSIPLEEVRESLEFKNIMYKLHNDIVGVIRAGMINSEGNITVYSLLNEIPQIQIGLDYQFAS